MNTIGFGKMTGLAIQYKIPVQTEFGPTTVITFSKQEVIEGRGRASGWPFASPVSTEPFNDILVLTFGDWQSTVYPLVMIHSDCSLLCSLMDNSLCNCAKTLHSSLKYLSEQGGILIRVKNTQEVKNIILNGQPNVLPTHTKHQSPKKNKKDSIIPEVLDLLGVIQIRLLSDTDQFKNPIEIEDVIIQEVVQAPAQANRGPILEKEERRIREVLKLL